MNDPPDISPQTVLIPECAVVGIPVTPVVNASDPDRDWLVYSVYSGNALGVFVFKNITSGNLTVARAGFMDFEGELGYESFNLRVAVADRQFTSDAMVTVEVTDCNGVHDFCLATSCAVSLRPAVR